MMPQRGQLTEQAYQTAKQRLLDGVYKAGNRISVEDIVAELGISRQPVMDALKRLSAEGYLEIIPQVGVRVVIPVRQDVRDFFRVLAATESVCAALAAERTDHAGSAKLAAINDNLAQLMQEEIDDEERARRFRVLNRDFHRQISALAQSDLVTPLTSSMWDHSDFFVNSVLETRVVIERMPAIRQEFEQICQAIAANDPNAAHQAMEAHVLAFARNVASE